MRQNQFYSLHLEYFVIRPFYLHSDQLFIAQFKETHAGDLQNFELSKWSVIQTPLISKWLSFGCKQADSSVGQAGLAWMKSVCKDAEKHDSCAPGVFWAGILPPKLTQYHGVILHRDKWVFKKYRLMNRRSVIESENRPVNSHSAYQVINRAPIYIKR